MKRDFKQFEIKNRKAEHEYFLVEKLQAGIVLSGSEIKSIRDGSANLSEAYCVIEQGDLWIKGMHISEYKQASYQNHEPTRTRKLLVNKKELNKLERKVSEKGFTLIPYRLYFSETGFLKLEIALAKGKKMYDKRETIKERDNKRELDRLQKQYK